MVRLCVEPSPEGRALPRRTVRLRHRRPGRNRSRLESSPQLAPKTVSSCAAGVGQTPVKDLVAGTPAPTNRRRRPRRKSCRTIGPAKPIRMTISSPALLSAGTLFCICIFLRGGAGDHLFGMCLSVSVPGDLFLDSCFSAGLPATNLLTDVRLSPPRSGKASFWRLAGCVPTFGDTGVLLDRRYRQLKHGVRCMKTPVARILAHVKPAPATDLWAASVGRFSNPRLSARAGGQYVGHFAAR